MLKLVNSKCVCVFLQEDQERIIRSSRLQLNSLATVKLLLALGTLGLAVFVEYEREQVCFILRIEKCLLESIRDVRQFPLVLCHHKYRTSLRSHSHPMFTSNRSLYSHIIDSFSVEFSFDELNIRAIFDIDWANLIITIPSLFALCYSDAASVFQSKVNRNFRLEFIPDIWKQIAGRDCC